MKISTSNPTSPTLTGEKVCSWKTPMFFSLIRFVWKMMTRIAIRKKIICLLATYLHKKPKLLSRPQEVVEIKDKENEVSSDVPIHTIVMPIRITFDNQIDFNDHFSKLKDFKKDFTVSLDSSESSILPYPLLDSDSPFTAELSASITLNSLENEDKVFKPGILVYHAIHDNNLVSLEDNLKENISARTLLVFNEPSFLLPLPELPDKCLNFEPILIMKNVVVNDDFYQSNVEDVNFFTIIIWIFLPYFTYTKDSPLIFSFRSYNSILSQLEAHGAEISKDDANNMFLRSLPFSMCLSKNSSLATPSTSSTIYSKKRVLAGFAEEKFEDARHQLANSNDAIRMKKFYKKTGRRVRVDGKTPVGFDKKKLECFNCHNTGHFARECTAKGTHDGRRWRILFITSTKLGRKQEKNQMGLLTMDDGIRQLGRHTEVEESKSCTYGIISAMKVICVLKLALIHIISLKHCSDEQMESVRFPCRNTSEHSFETESESLDEPNEMSKSRLEVTNEKDVSVPNSKENWNDMMERELGEGYSFTKKKCFVCGSLSHLIKDCDYYEKKMAREAEVKRVVNTGNGVTKPVWTNANRINHSNKFVPRSVQLNAGRPKFNSVRPNINTGRTNISSGRPKVNTVSPKVNTVSPKVNTVRPRQPAPHTTSNSLSPKRPQMNQINQRRDFSTSYSSVRRPFAKSTAQMTHTNAVMGSWGILRPSSARHGSRGIFDSGCSGHMTGNKDQLEDFEEFNWDSVTFGQHKVLFTETECLVVSSDFKMPDENQILLKNQANNAGISEETNSAGTSQTPESIASEEKDEEVELIVVPSAVKILEEKDESRTTFPNSKTGSPENITTSTHSVNTGSQTVNTGRLDHDDLLMPELEIFHKPETGIFDEASYDEEGVITDFNSLPTEIDSRATLTWIHVFTQKVKYLVILNQLCKLGAKCRTNQELMLFSVILKNNKETITKINNIVCLHVFYLKRNLKRLLKLYKMIVGFKQCKKNCYSSSYNIMGSCRSTSWNEGDLAQWVYRNKRDEKGVVVREQSKIGNSKDFSSHAARMRIFKKSTTGGCQFLGQRLISWQCKKQTIVATSTTEAEYVAAANCCGQVLWVQNQLLDYGFNFMNTKIHIDNESTICIVKNPVYHSKTKHIEIRHHFIRDCYEKKHKHWHSMDEREECQGFAEIVDFLRGSNLRYALTTNPTIYDSLVKQFWQTATTITHANGTLEIKATIDTIRYTISEASIRESLQLEDATGITMLPNDELFEGMGQIGYPTDGTFTFWKSFFTPQWRYLVHHLLHCISSKSGGWDQFGSNIALIDSVYPLIFGNMKRGFRGAPRPLLPSMLLVATNPNAGQEHAAVAQSQPSSSTPQVQSPPPIPTPTPPPIPTPTPPPIPTPIPTPIPIPTPTPTPPPIPTPIPTPIPIPTPTPIPDTEPTPLEHIYEEQSPVHHHFSPPQEQAPSQMPMDDLLHEVPKLISRIDSLETDLKQTKLTMGNAIVKLVKKVKKLEGFLKRRNLVLSDSEEEEPEVQGRKSQDDPLDSSVQGLVTPSTTKVNASGEEQVEDISPNTLEAAKTLSKVASLKPSSIDKGRRYKRRKETKGKKVVSSLDFQEEVDTVA
ncbi:putative ribonuclease H-like domain-containing protein [Tanacetum coccineum]